MRVLVLGGAGDMGRRAVRELADEPSVTRLTIGDYRLDQARAVAAAIEARPDRRTDRPIEVAQVDVRDGQALEALMAEHDVVGGAVGPFYRFEVPMVRAAIGARRPYVSICDDYDAAKAVLELDEEADRAGVAVLTGCGWTPGLSNILARRGADLLDQVHSIDISWAGASADSKGYAVVLHTIHIFTGRVPTFRDGAWADVPAGSEPVAVDFPEPIGRVRVFHVGHPEPVTLPRYLPGVRSVSLRGGLTEPFLNWLGLAIARLGLTNTPQKKDRLGRLIKASLPWLEKLGPAGVAASGIHVQVAGEKGGRPLRHTFRAAAHMEELTGIPLALAILAVGQGRVRRTGVFAPEAPGAIDPESFLAALAARGVTVEHQVA